jgi:histidyl-tRNA synthetase
MRCSIMSFRRRIIMAINKVKGTYDVLPTESYLWQALEDKIRSTLKVYNIKEVRTPIMEYSEVFHRQSELSDMVTKKLMTLMIVAIEN